MRKIVEAKDSRAIAADMQGPPFTELSIFDQMSIRKLYGYEILTYLDYLRVRDRNLKKKQDSG